MVLYGHSSVGRAQVSKTWCREFESLCPCQICLFTPEMVFFYFNIAFYFIIVYSGYVMENVINIFFFFIYFLVFIFVVLLAAFILGGFLIAILGYFRVKRLEDPEILQNKIKSHRRVLNIFAGILSFISIVHTYITVESMNFAMVGTWLCGLIAMPFAYVIIYNLSFIIFAKLKDIRLKLQELEMLKRSNRF